MVISDFIQIGILVATLFGSILIYISFSAQTIVSAKQLQIMELEQKILFAEVYPHFSIINVIESGYNYNDEIIFNNDYIIKIKNNSLKGKAYNIRTQNELYLLVNEFGDLTDECEPNMEFKLKIEVDNDIYLEATDYCTFELTFESSDGINFKQKIYLNSDYYGISPIMKIK